MGIGTEVERVAGVRTTRVRYGVVAFICFLAIVSYLDRVCISESAPFFVAELKLTSVQMGLVFGAFILSYGVLGVPEGWLGDKIGPRKVITGLVLSFSAFTALTGLVHQLWSLVIVRFLFGAAEAGAFPNASKAISRWIPTKQWGIAQGLMWMCGRLGGAFAPGLVVLLIPYVGWRHSFSVFAAVGLIWAILFWWWFRDTPREKPGVSAEEVKIIESSPTKAASAHMHGAKQGPVKVPWARLLRNANLWAICGLYFCMSYGWHFYMTWLPTYMKAQGATTVESGIYGGMPYFFGAFGCVLGGLLTDYVVRKTGSVKNRRYIGAVGYVLMGICMLRVAWVRDPLTSALTISMASFFGDLTLSSSWAVCMDVGHEIAGTISGWMSAWGNVGGFLFPIVTGFLVQDFGNWKLPIIVAAGMFFLGALFWLRVDATKSVLD
jgi:MFS transporter, ACS family, glucarate transporter